LTIFHYSGQVISRSTGSNSVAKAAYRSATPLNDKRTGLIYEYTKRRQEIYAEIIAPVNSPEWV